MPYTPPLIEKSEVVPKGPWEYAMNVLAVHAFGDSEEISSEIGFETDGELWFYFAEIISRSPNFPELNYETPQLVQYNEAAIFVKVFVKNKSFAYCPFMYVDNDLSLVRGLLVGFPKKIANIAITKRHPLIQQSKIGANVCRAGYRLLKAVVEVEKESSSVPFDKFGPWLLRRYFEPLNIDQHLIFKFEAKYGKIETGKAEIEVVGGLNDKLDAFKPEEVKSGYYFETLLKAKGVENADF